MSAVNLQQQLSGNNRQLTDFAKDIDKVLISQDEIAARVTELGEQISRDYEGKDLVLVGVLKGSAIFLSDLARKITVPLSLDFVTISSYGSNSKSSGEVRLIKDIDESVDSKHVLVVEDIIDTGWTLRLSYLEETLLSRNASSVKICALLDKPSRREVDVKIDYCGFSIEDHYVVGYGMDYNGKYRNLPFIGILKSEIYETS